MTHINGAFSKLLTLLVFLLFLIVGTSGCGLFKNASRPEVILLDSVRTSESLDTTLGPLRPVVIPNNSITFVLNPKKLETKPTDTFRKGSLNSGYTYKDSNLIIFCNLDSMVLLADSLRTMLVTKTTEIDHYQTRTVENISLQNSLKSDRQKLLYWLIGIIALNVLVIGVYLVMKIKGTPASAVTKITGAVKKGLDS